MKTSKTKILFLVSSVTLSACASLCGVLVCESQLPYMTKYSFVMLLLIGVCVLLGLLANSFERLSEQLNGNLLTKKEEELQVAGEQLKAVQTQLQTTKEQLLAQQKQTEYLKTQIPASGKENPVSNEIDMMRKKCETIESFRNSFPYKIADGYILYNVIRTEIQVSGYSRWQLVGEYEGQLWEYTLLRPDTQSYKEMLSLAAATNAPAELEELNISDQLLWN